VPKKPWGGRFAKETDATVEAFTASVHFDRRLAPYDIEGSIAHCRMLARQKIISSAEADKIVRGLRSVGKEIADGTFPFRPEYEDIHMNIERRLIEKVGAVGGKLHTARSRNDQVALDTRLYLRHEIDKIDTLLRELMLALVRKARDEVDVIMPGFTHLQIAQPVPFAHHLLAYCEMFARDRERLSDCAGRVNRMPLGSGALSGTSFEIDRRYVAEQLGFRAVTQNSMDAVSDRDYIIEFLAGASLIMMHLSRFCEELVLWTSEPFSFVEIGDDYCTGSSIMPQKKNPDIPELVRGKTGRVYGHLMALLTTLKGLPLAYNRDLQEDKEPLFDTVDTLQGSLTVFTGMLRSLTVRAERMEAVAGRGFSTATDLADYLVRKGLPFRQAHEVTGAVIRFCIESGRDLPAVRLDELRGFHPDIDEDVYEVIDPRRSVSARDIPGGTAPSRVRRRLREMEQSLSRPSRAKGAGKPKGR
jgi:argininosuccinate lyase